MKKIICAILCVAIILSIAVEFLIKKVDIGIVKSLLDETQSESSAQEQESESEQSNESTTNTNSNTTNNNTPNSNSNNNTSNNTNNTNNNITNSNNSNSTNTNTDNGIVEPLPESLKNVNNGVLKQASAKTMDVPENMKLMGITTVTEEKNSDNIKATAVLYMLDGNVVNWTTENDFIYVITQGNNRLVIIDTKTMAPVYNSPLDSVPAEMNIVGDKIYVSLPNLKRIDIFSKANCQKESSISFSNEVSSFCVEGDYIYYTQHSNHCKVFKKNLISGEETVIQKNGNYVSFYCPKICLNKEERILYIGESDSSGCSLYYYNADTLELIGVFQKNNYGVSYASREMFLIEDTLYWGNYAISATNPDELLKHYGTSDSGNLVYASKYLVSTYDGLFLTDTCECIVDYFKAGFDFRSILITDSYNIFFRQTVLDKNIIIGINFNLQ